ncbi:hypothetical protein IIO_02624 [Bacillus cereus VD115]|nr:hypothetical protein IIO_02624 [Bacillus cereus VD115]
MNEDGKLVVYKLSNQEGTEIERVQASGDGISYALLYNGSTEERVGRSLEKVLLKYIREIGYNTPNKAIRIQRKLNNYIADVDDSVNKITFNLTIKHP